MTYFFELAGNGVNAVGTLRALSVDDAERRVRGKAAKRGAACWTLTRSRLSRSGGADSTPSTIPGTEAGAVLRSGGEACS